MRVKVAVETSVLIASSLYIVSKELRSTKIAKDPHYDRAIKLTLKLRRSVRQRVGVYTGRIARQARNTVRDAARRCLDREGCKPQNVSIILNHCSDRLERILETLVLEPIEQSDKDRLFTQVIQMYTLLLQRSSLVTDQTIRSLAQAKANQTASPHFRRIQADIQQRQIGRDLRQLYNLKANPPEISDYEILAEVVALRESYVTEAPTQLLLASTDSSHFSPIRYADGTVSDQVTKQIEETFHIKCDWPDTIADMLPEPGDQTES